MIDVLVDDARRDRRARSKSASRGRWRSCSGRFPGVEYVYSTSSPGSSLVDRSLPGRRGRGGRDRPTEPETPRELSTSSRRARAGRSSSRARSTTCRARAHAFERPLRRVHAAAASPPRSDDAIKEVPDVSEVKLIGGERRQAARRARRRPNGGVSASLQRSSVRCSTRRTGSALRQLLGGQPRVPRRDRRFLRNATTWAGSSSASHGGRPSPCATSPTIEDGAEEPADYVHSVRTRAR